MKNNNKIKRIIFILIWLFILSSCTIYINYYNESHKENKIIINKDINKKPTHKNKQVFTKKNNYQTNFASQTKSYCNIYKITSSPF